MTKKELAIYGAYVYNQRCRMEADIKQLELNLRYHKDISPLDCLELIIAKVRYECFCEFVHNFKGLVHIKDVED